MTQRVPKTARRKIGQAPVASDPDVSCVSLLGSIESLFHADMQVPVLHALIDYSPGRHKHEPRHRVVSLHQFNSLYL